MDTPKKAPASVDQEIYDCLGPHYFRCAYRTTFDSFWILHSKTFRLIRHYAARAIRREKKTGVKQVGGDHPPPPNGRITTSARLGGLLAPGLVLFGDNAYINSSFMATPFPNVSSGSKDDYNFFHSQLRIRVECAFGMLVHRWGILRSAIPMGITIQKTVALVNALAKLHNYCIDRKDGTDTVCEPTAEDLANITTSEGGYVSMVRVDACDVELPVPLMGAGHHFDHIPRSHRQSDRQHSTNIVLPRTLLLNKVVASDMTRPMVKRRK
ncbi:hypothetical protein ACHAW5_000595 [Stephanodiscus triporus]|uniref:DDE Tnp4 domain-containing protein n=1 Tax=Stephanodiscus triporus TaxID=2934178 RepID=A0ABD3NV20_9STRA